jgi:Tol biopolymer transport system component
LKSLAGRCINGGVRLVEGSVVTRRIASMLAVVAALCAVPPASASTFPGANGLVLVTLSGAATDPIRLYLVDPLSGLARPLVPGESPLVNEAAGQISADGRTVVFKRTFYGQVVGDLWLIHTDGRGLRRLTNTPYNNEGDPAFSPDGRVVAFSRGDQYGADAQIYSIHTDGTHLTRLTANAYVNSEATFSPDGSTIAWARYRSSGRHEFTQIRLMDADGRDRRALVAAPRDVEVSTPNFSPDGSKVLFTRNAPGVQNADIWEVDADGANAHYVYGFATNWESRAVFSPDGSEIAFDSQPITPFGPSTVQVMNADGTDPRVLIGSFAGLAEADGPNWGPAPG